MGILIIFFFRRVVWWGVIGLMCFLLVVQNLVQFMVIMLWLGFCFVVNFCDGGDKRLEKYLSNNEFVQSFDVYFFFFDIMNGGYVGVILFLNFFSIDEFGKFVFGEESFDEVYVCKILYMDFVDLQGFLELGVLRVVVGVFCGF